MSKIFSITGSGLELVETGGIPLGSVIHSDHWHFDVVIVSEEPGHYGQQAIKSDGTAEYEVSRTSIGRLAIPFWVATEIVCTPEHCEALREKLMKHREKQHAQSMRDTEERDAAEKLGAEYLAEHRPQWAKAVIVAELQKDESDSMTDYFASKTVKTLVLAWSKHTRDLFPEMRKAAKRAPILPTEWVEHREKYSMGKGYYLGEGRSSYSGWHIRKLNLGYSTSELDAVIGRAVRADKLGEVYFAEDKS